jgi:quercetin dioxygenase-like cupin family protein
MTRRDLFGAAVAAGLFGQVAANAEGAAARQRGPILEQDLPDVDLGGWSVTAVEVRYEPGASSKPHRHPGFVLGYVLEGEIAFQIEGGPKRVCRVGDMFYEPPGSVHLVSANTSTTQPARMLAMVFAEKGVPRSTPA